MLTAPAMWPCGELARLAHVDHGGAGVDRLGDFSTSPTLIEAFGNVDEELVDGGQHLGIDFLGRHGRGFCGLGRDFASAPLHAFQPPGNDFTLS